MNAELLQLRAAVLGSAGIDVTKSTNVSEAEQMIEDSQWDALVICHTVRRCELLVKRFRERQPQGKVVVMVLMPDGEPCAKGDAYIAGLDGPATLIQAVIAP